MADAVAFALLYKTNLVAENRPFDPAQCARAGFGRIGEGPRRPRSGLREGLLADVPLVGPRTLEIQDKVWAGFLASHGTVLDHGEQVGDDGTDGSQNTLAVCNLPCDASSGSWMAMEAFFWNTCAWLFRHSQAWRDMLSDDDKVAYLKIVKPKTRF